MKIFIEIEKDGEGKDGMEGYDEEGMQKKMVASAFQKRVAKMLAKAAGRNTPNELDMEAAKDFEEDNAEYSGMKK